MSEQPTSAAAPPRPAPRTATDRALRRAEVAIEFTLLAARWLLMPLYLMLMAVLVVFAISAGRELWDLFAHATNVSEAELILSALALIDLALVGGLRVMVALSGYETFVSRFDNADEAEVPAWLGKLDLGTVKLKLAASIVAISGIHLLKQYMKIDEVDNERLLTLAVIHLAFVGSALLLALVDRMAFAGRH
ncbi:MAG: TIGR00645 family protein [Sporichthyaceae bacterium]